MKTSPRPSLKPGLLFAAWLLATSLACAEVRTVTNAADALADAPVGSLRRVIAEATPGDIIRFAPEVTGTRKVRLTMRPATGLFSGSFLHPDGKQRTFTGVCIQQPGDAPDVAEGLFETSTEPGQVELVATVPWCI